MIEALAKRARAPQSFLMVLSAPSGGGKTTVCEALLRRQTWLSRAVTATTRSPRLGEKDGRDYYFLSREQFLRRIKAGAFYEWAEVHGNLYGTPKKEVRAALKAGKSLVLVIDVQGGAQVRAKDKDALLVFLLPPSFTALKERLKKRAQDSASSLKRRLNEAEKEAKASKFYDYVVVNDRLDLAVSHVEEIARAARWRQRRG
jgi:guanylate kinase